MLTPNPREVVTHQALVVYLAAVFVYVAAILGRTSFGVAGVEAIDRFEVDASRIAVFTAVQLGTYALAQIPTGMAIDKFGPRTMLVVGALVMAVGQITLGLTNSYGVAIGARVLIGGGDATAFLSVMRLIPAWFPMKKAPLFAQAASALGQIGQFLSAVPFLWLLGVSGWTTAFVSLGAVGLIIALSAAVAVKDSPNTASFGDVHSGATDSLSDAPLTSQSPQPQAAPQSIIKRLGAVIRHPAAWQTFFIHFTGLSTQLVFVLLWGVPLMTQGMGLSSSTAGALLTLNTVILVLVGPLHGMISARNSGRRDVIVFVSCLVLLCCYAWFFSAEQPRGVVAIAFVVIMLGLISPVANYGFDIVREQMDMKVVATGTGLGNMGGFIAGMSGAQLFGLLLDYSADGQSYGWEDFRFASLGMASVWVIGFVGIVLTGIARRRRESARVRIRSEEPPASPRDTPRPPQ